MKTPREILFERHSSAEPKLDEIRQNVVAAESPSSLPSPPLGEKVPARADEGDRFLERGGVRGLVFNVWRELIWPCRRLWAGLAAIWLVLLLFNFSRDNRAQTIAKNSPPPGPAVAAALQEQRRLFARLLEPFPRTPAVPPKTPGPRGALPPVVKIA